jgi:dTDP-4-amino-4,6-dideoxygalactose transaminase
LDDPSLRYFYLARNAIYALVELWKLRDQEVLFPAYCHGVEVDTLLAAGVKLRFYPVDINMQVKVEEIVSLLSPKTRAVYLIHYLGFPGPADELSRICRDRGLLLIEDCALALLSREGDKPLGSFGDASVFCFYKTLPAPDGGALLLRNPSSVRWPKTSAPPLASTLAYTCTAIWRHLQVDSGGGIHRFLRVARKSVKSMSGRLGIVPVGSQYFDRDKADIAMSRLGHWLLARQDYDAIVERRRRNYTRLLNHLREIAPPVLGELPEGVCPLFYPIRARQKLATQRLLFQRGIETVNFWSRTPASVPKGAFPEVETLRRTILELPCHQDLSFDSVDWIARQVRDLSVDWLD